MAGRDGDEPKEGVDFKWVKAENSNAMVRKFFTKADKAAAKEPAKAAPKKDKPAAKAAPKASPKPKAKPEAKDRDYKADLPKAKPEAKPAPKDRDYKADLPKAKPEAKPEPKDRDYKADLPKDKKESRSAAAMGAMGALGAAVMASGRKPKPPAKPSTGTSVARNYGSIGEGKFMGRMDTEGKTRQERLAERLKQVRAQTDAKAVGTNRATSIASSGRPEAISATRRLELGKPTPVEDKAPKAKEAPKAKSKTSPKGKKRAGSGGRGGGSLMAPIMRHFDDINANLPRLAKGGMVKGKKK